MSLPMCDKNHISVEFTLPTFFSGVRQDTAIQASPRSPSCSIGMPASVAGVRVLGFWAAVYVLDTTSTHHLVRRAVPGE